MRGSHYFGLILFALSVAGCTNLELAATALKKVNNINNDPATSQTNTPTPIIKLAIHMKFLVYGTILNVI